MAKKFDIKASAMRLAAIAAGVVVSGVAGVEIGKQIEAQVKTATDATDEQKAAALKNKDYIYSAVMIAAGFLLPYLATVGKMPKMLPFLSDVGDIFLDRGVTKLLISMNALGADTESKIGAPAFLPVSVNDSQNFINMAQQANRMLLPALDANSNSFINCPPIVATEDYLVNDLGQIVKIDPLTGLAYVNTIEKTTDASNFAC